MGESTMLGTEVIWSICGAVVFILMCAAALLCFFHERKRQKRHDQLLENLTRATHPQFSTPKSPWSTDTSGDTLAPPTSAFNPMRLSLVPDSRNPRTSAVGPHIPGSHIPMMVTSHGVPTAAGTVHVHSPSIASTRDRTSGPRPNPLRSPETIQHRSHLSSERRTSDERTAHDTHHTTHETHRTSVGKHDGHDQKNNLERHNVGLRTSMEAASKAHAHLPRRTSTENNHRFSVDNQNRVLAELPNDRTNPNSSDS